MARGKFIALESIDAGGKHTQSKLLAEKLNALLISFPRDETEIGKLIRAKLKGEWYAARSTVFRPGMSTAYMDAQADAIVLQALFTFDRYDAAPEIVDALDSGKNVVADRYWGSGLVYGESDGLDRGMLERVHEYLPQPDVWVLLDVPVEESFRRRPARGDVYESNYKKLEWIRQRYLKFFEEECADTLRAKNLTGHLRNCEGCDLDRMIKQRAGQKWAVVDGVGTIDQVYERIAGVI